MFNNNTTDYSEKEMLLLLLEPSACRSVKYNAQKICTAVDTLFVILSLLCSW